MAGKKMPPMSEMPMMKGYGAAGAVKKTSTASKSAPRNLKKGAGTGKGKSKNPYA